MSESKCTYAALEAEYSGEPAPERIPATITYGIQYIAPKVCIRILFLPEAVQMIEPPDLSLPPFPVIFMAGPA